jgi:hypothetical protein
MESATSPPKPSAETLKYQLQITQRDLELYKDIVCRLERQLNTLKSQVEALTAAKDQLTRLLGEKDTLLVAAKAERDEALCEKFQLFREANERSTSAASSYSRTSDLYSNLEEQLFKARADNCQLKAVHEDCLFERNEAQRLLKVGNMQIRDEEIKRLTVWMEKNRVVAPRTIGGNREVGGMSGRGRDGMLTFIGK